LELGEDARGRAQVAREQTGPVKDGEKRAGFSSEETGGAEGILPSPKPILHKGRTILHFLVISKNA